MATTYPIRILSQLGPVLQGFRKSRGLTQADIAARLGVSQQSYARLEANPGRASMARVLAALQALEVDLTLTPRVAAEAAGAAGARRGKSPVKTAKTVKAVKTVKPAKTARPAPARKRGADQGEDW